MVSASAPRIAATFIKKVSVFPVSVRMYQRDSVEIANVLSKQLIIKLSYNNRIALLTKFVTNSHFLISFNKIICLIIQGFRKEK